MHGDRLHALELVLLLARLLLLAGGVVLSRLEERALPQGEGVRSQIRAVTGWGMAM